MSPRPPEARGWTDDGIVVRARKAAQKARIAGKRRGYRLTLAELRRLAQRDGWCLCLTCEAIRAHDPRRRAKRKNKHPDAVA